MRSRKPLDVSQPGLLSCYNVLDRPLLPGEEPSKPNARDVTPESKESLYLGMN